MAPSKVAPVASAYLANAGASMRRRIVPESKIPAVVLRIGVDFP